MPHDVNGRALKLKDLVNIPCLVIAIHQGEYCNLALESVEPMYPAKHKSSFTANAKQVTIAREEWTLTIEDLAGETCAVLREPEKMAYSVPITEQQQAWFNALKNLMRGETWPQQEG